MGVLIDQISADFSKVFSADQTTTTLTRLVPTTTEPIASATRGVIEVAANGGILAANNIQLLFMLDGAGYKLGDATHAGVCIVGWRKVKGSGLTTLWIPVTLGEFYLVAGTLPVGVAGTPVLADGATHTIAGYFCSQIAQMAGIGNANVSNETVSPGGGTTASDSIAHLIIGTKGHPKIEVQLATNSGGATQSGHHNCLACVA